MKLMLHREQKVQVSDTTMLSKKLKLATNKKLKTINHKLLWKDMN
jgi:hypothetical protein